MSFDVPQQIEACKRRIEIVRVLIQEAKAKGEIPTEEERQVMLEMQLLRMLEAQLASAVPCELDSS